MTTTRQAVRAATAVLVTVPLCLLLGACGANSGNDAADAPADATSAPATTAPASPAAESPSTTPATPDATSDVTASPAAPSSAAPSTTTAATDLTKYSLAGLKSPSGNIACLFATAPVSVRCDLRNADWNVATPASCPLEYGDSAFLGKHKAVLTCHGDTVFGAPHQSVLPYGQSVRYHDITCTSQASGVTCTNAAGHGFTVSRATYSLH